MVKKAKPRTPKGAAPPMRYAVALRTGGLLSFGSGVLTDETTAKEWAIRVHGWVLTIPVRGEP